MQSTQDPRLDFAAVLRRATRTTRLLQAIGAVLLAVVAGRAGWLNQGVVGLWSRFKGMGGGVV